jgi:hypothetical protein
LFMLCRFHIAAEGRHSDKQLIWHPCPECHEASKHHLLKFGFLLFVRFNLGFTTKGRPTTVLIIPSSWGSQWAVLTSHQAVFLAPLPGIEEEEAPTSTTRSHVNYAPAGGDGRSGPGWRGQGLTRATWCPLLLLSPSPSGYFRLMIIYEFLGISLELLIFRKIWCLGGPFYSRILTPAASSPMIIKHVKTEETT